MAVTTVSLVPLLQRKVHDLARRIPNEPIGTGDGTKTVFYVDYPPISADSQNIYLDGVLQEENTDYTFDNDFGRATFEIAPSEGQKVTADYNGLFFHSDDILGYVEDAVEGLSVCYTGDLFTITNPGTGNVITPEPNQIEKQLIVYQARLTLLISQAQKWGSEGLRLARTGMSMDTTKRAEYLNELVEVLEAQLDKLCRRHQVRRVYMSTDSTLKW